LVGQRILARGGVQRRAVLGPAGRRLNGGGVHLRLAHHLPDKRKLVAGRRVGGRIYATAEQLVERRRAGNGHAHVHAGALHAVAHHRADADGQWVGVLHVGKPGWETRKFAVEVAAGPARGQGHVGVGARSPDIGGPEVREVGAGVAHALHHAELAVLIHVVQRRHGRVNTRGRGERQYLVLSQRQGGPRRHQGRVLVQRDNHVQAIVAALQLNDDQHLIRLRGGVGKSRQRGRVPVGPNG